VHGAAPPHDDDAWFHDAGDAGHARKRDSPFAAGLLPQASPTRKPEQ